MPETPTASVSMPRHMPALDGVRGLAIALVLAHNTQTLQSAPCGVTRLVEIVFDRGWMGVQLFFVLSGFLITGILFDTQRSQFYFRNFYVRRVLRIFPLYYLSLIIMLVLLPCAGLTQQPPKNGWLGQWPLWFYFSNWVLPLGWNDHGLPHFWSLAVEEQFYLLWPFLIRYQSPSKVIRWCLVLALMSLLVRWFLTLKGPNNEQLYFFSICRIDALVLGAAAAAMVRVPTLSRHFVRNQTLFIGGAIALGLLGLLVTRGYPRTDPVSQVWGYSILATVFATLVLVAAYGDTHGHTRLTQWLRWRFPRTLGKYSYGIYVIHKPLHDLLGKRLIAALRLPTQSALGSIAYVGANACVSLLLAMLSYHFFEAQFLDLKSHFSSAD